MLGEIQDWVTNASVNFAQKNAYFLQNEALGYSNCTLITVLLENMTRETDFWLHELSVNHVFFEIAVHDGFLYLPNNVSNSVSTSRVSCDGSLGPSLRNRHTSRKGGEEGMDNSEQQELVGCEHASAGGTGKTPYWLLIQFDLLVLLEMIV